MATAYAHPASALQSPRQHYLQPNPPPQRRHASRQKFAQDFSQCLYDFVIQLLPTTEELAVKEDVRKLLERLIRTIELDSRLLSFGSTANGFSLRNSDMDLCCLIDSEERLSATDLVNMLGDLLERETKFHVKPLPHARIPIVKLSLDPAPGLPFGIACDIGFENRLALENTRLLMCYAMIDPARVRTMVLFLKVWSKRRKINSPYKGTLSSYGYVLLVIYFLVHVKSPPVLPNLQQVPPLRPISKEDTHLNGHNIWFFDDIELLRQRWKSSNTESVAELLIDFFKYYSRDFNYSSGVASIRAGLLKKDSKGWVSEAEKGSPRERNRLCIEDPFETDFNVARCVTRDGLYTIRGEFMRASRILSSRPERAIVALAQLCEERKEEELLHPSPARGAFVPPRLSPIPPQVPYTVNSSPMRPPRLPVADTLSPSELHAPSPSSPAPSSSPASASASASPPQQPAPSLPQVEVPKPLPLDQLEHMAPKRGKWTSPPPPEAPAEDHTSFESRLGQGLALATEAGPARERDHERNSHGASYASSNASEVHTDDDARSELAESDDVHSVRSFTEEGALNRRRDKERERQRDDEREPTVTLERQQLRQMRPSTLEQAYELPAPRAAGRPEGGLDARMLARLRGRPVLRLAQQMSDMGLGAGEDVRETFAPSALDSPRRSLSGPARTFLPHRFAQLQSPAAFAPGPAYPSPADVTTTAQPPPFTNVYYETTPVKERLFRMLQPYGVPAPAMPPVSPHQVYDTPDYYQTAGPSSSSPSSSPRHMFAAPPASSSTRQANPRQTSPRHLPPSLRRSSKLAEMPAPQVPYDTNMLLPSSAHARYSHSHTPSTATITSATTPRAHVQTFASTQHLGPSLSRSRSPPYPVSSPQSRPHSRQQLPPRLSGDRGLRPASPFASISSGSGSPPMSCTSSQYAASCSPLSTSPPSPTNSDGHPKPTRFYNINGSARE
ncbi:hypothetical protein IEO21_05671 [Rhodonia placenta]|uniref:polynucleotide adenylyltransferase n=1 Tax=Rhodonia placenta TaxID=104341 RepID=A0A8H7P1J7_9APHY|nr:hypothetical protein IEO21_05671 [Postia placenta]